MKIIGNVLVLNEDRFIESVLRNIVDFCDEVIVVIDYMTRDKTSDIVAALAAEKPKISYRKIVQLSTSHRLLEPYAGTDTWIFAVDGDEIYDPAGLMRFRKRMEVGEFDKWWCVFCNVLNCVRLDESRNIAEGYLAPPCRSVTKLYNFAAIDAWEGPCVERLHGGNIRFRSGYEISLRYNLHEQVDWDDADLRCLHTCFLPRSSLDSKDAAFRLNIMDRQAVPWWRRKLSLNKEYVPWKLQKYKRGKLVRKDSTPFFPTIAK